jgi:nitroimidazol reductase NimA-like FMN-containing flavoprotein (pyridoxamine 5'-phosphate oxidase superfamily)
MNLEMHPARSWPGGRLAELTPAECLDLIDDEQVGRVVYCDDHGPLALPVNFVVQERTILFRTAQDNALARHLIESATCAFEVDHVDHLLRSGWSVLARGSAAVVRHLSSDADAAWPLPWPEGARPLIIRITPLELSGRRLVPS